VIYALEEMKRIEGGLIVDHGLGMNEIERKLNFLDDNSKDE
jgi:hypothetical protein